LDREAQFWVAALALDEQGALACRAKLDQLDAERVEIVRHQDAVRHILPQRARLAERLGV
jgi:negative regulator of sigma E activity